MKKYTLIVPFFIMLFVIGFLDISVPTRVFSELENRYLAIRPVLRLRSLKTGDYMKRYEQYIDDQFVFRDRWIDMKSNMERLLGKVENNGIVLGKDNYLFDKQLFVNEERILTHVEALREFSRNVEQSINFMLIPSSFEIHREKLPHRLQLVNQNKWIQKIYQEAPELETIDIVPALLERRDEYIYFRTDHHWTTLGAYYAYREMSKQIDFTPVKRETHQGHQVEGFFGTFHTRARFSKVEADTITYYEFPGVVYYIHDKGTRHDNLYDLSMFEERDKYRAFLHGNFGHSTTINPAIEDGKLLIIKDSFSNSLIPFLTQHFHKIDIIDLRFFRGSISDFANEGNFDHIAVIYSFQNFMDDASVRRLGN